MGLFDNLLAPFSGDAGRAAADARIQSLQQANRTANRRLDAGLGDLRGYYEQAGSYFEPLAELAGERAGLYDDAVGVGGVEGLQRARELFTQTPGYQEGFDMGLDALERRAAARGQLASGNTTADTLRFASDYANQRYGDYVSRLQPFVGGELPIAGAQAGLQTTLGDRHYGDAVTRAGIDFQTQQGIGQAQADRAMADYRAGQNLWGGILGLADVGSKFVPWGRK